MRKLTYALNSAFITLNRSTFIFLFVAIFSQSAWGQCTPENNSISGTVFEDKQNDGIFKDADVGLSNILVTAYNADGNSVGSSVSDVNGIYSIDNLPNGNSYRLVFENSGSYYSSILGEDNRSSVQFVESPACEINYGLTRSNSACGTNPDLVLTCFVQGTVDDNPSVETIISVEHGFNSVSSVSKIATQSETGSIWGIVHDPNTESFYSASFVKQYAGLKYTPYTILKTETTGAKKTTAFVDVNSLIPQNLLGLSVTDINDCTYGDQVGRVGLGSIIMSPDGGKLYTAILDEGLVVGVDIDNPIASTTDVFTMPRPVNIEPDEEYRIFALQWNEGMIYVGGTVTASVSEDKNVSAAVIMTLDPQTGATQEIFRTNFIQGHWQDDQPKSLNTSHWLTDLAFTDSGEIIISLSDRIGHRYCNSDNNRLDQQFPDILMVGFDEDKQEWILEDNGSINGRPGSGVGNNQGPGGGEFFGFDFWPTNASYHSETALGSVFVLPGSNEVVATVYDPLVNSYSGGLHRYSTVDGSKTGAIELYSHTTFPVFGKATGFGDITGVCTVESIEIGNYVWYDSNGNGLQDPGEEGIEGVGLNLFDSDCNLIGTTTTDENGTYAFNDTNVDADGDGEFEGVFPDITYYVGIDNAIYDEVTGLYTLGSDEYTICTANSGTESEDNIDCDAEYNETSCFTSAFIEVNTGATNHSFDIGLGAPSGFDLALKKEIVGSQFAKVGEDMTFIITVYNQGGVSASSVTITDYIPTGYSFDPDKNNGWDVENGLLVSTIAQKILPGRNVSKVLKLKVENIQAANYLNIAEISNALDLAGEPADDVDSTPDAIFDNDEGGVPFTSTDNQLNGIGIFDEDDHDIAVPKIFDLAVKTTLADDKYYYADDVVKFDITVYNQGNVDADLVELTNYYPDELKLNTDLSSGWEVVDGNGYFRDLEILEAGEVREYCIYFDVAKGIIGAEVIDYVEISGSSPVDHPGSIDFDSSPDADDDNDMGGDIYSSTDNQVNDHGLVDEDDHDPVVIKTRYVDLALRKTAEKRGVRAGEDVDFTIEVINQGSAPIYKIEVIDYIPEFMTLNDDNWISIDDSKATRLIELDNPLTKGQNTSVTITLRLDDGLEPMSFVNYAEITGAKNLDNVEIGIKDIDSTPDDDEKNDNGGVPDSATDNEINSTKDIDEDDQDPARVSMIVGSIENSECLENATNSNNGQFEDVFKITAPAGETWYLFDQANYYDISSPDPADGPLVDLVTGVATTMDEMPIDAEMSMYTFSVIREDGKDGYIVFRNLDTDDIETFNVSAMMYEDIIITGDQALCDGQTKEYCVADPDPLVDYEWSVPIGASFITLSPTCIEIDWGSVAPNMSYSLSVEADGGCNVPGSINVSIGTSSGAMSCLGFTNLSLDGDCEVQITPELILTSDILPGQAYSVMLTTESGEVIPNATLTSEHLGMTVTAKVIDGCSGNSCWGTILVEDKIKPTIECEDAFISCNKVDEFGGPFAEDNCGGPVEVIMLNETFTPLQCDSYSAEIYRTYQAIDASGNKSEICEMTIFVELIDLDDIVFPDNLIMMDGTALNCDAYDLDMDGVADVDITGRPTYNGEYVYPDFDPLCNTGITFEDDIRFINGVKKITRTWTAWNWYCSSTITREHEQFIEIRDIDDPMIECPEDMTISAAVGNCEGIISLPLPIVSDECSDEITIQTITQVTSIIEEGDSRVVAFPYNTSPYVVTYRATDGAGNSSECEMTVTVVDDIAPIAICDQNTIVGLNSLGEGYLYAMNLDDGSYDACQLTDMMIRRVDDNGPFADKVLFTCDDLGEPVMVELRVYDAGGLSNSCMANVIVQDKHAPVVNDLPDVTIECGDSFTPLSQFGEFTYTDACNVTTQEDSLISLNVCGIGTIVRTFTASDSDGSDTETQTITVINSEPFDEDDIVSWPLDYDVTITTCDGGDFHPDNLPAPYAYPVWNDDTCDLVAAGYEDDLYPLIDDPNSICYKIVRMWTIIDWCQLDDDGDPREFESTQIIKVTNTKKPDQIEVSPEVETIVSSDCDTGLLNFTATSDDCSPELLTWTILVDLDQDFVSTGVYDITRTGYGPVASLNEIVAQGTHNIVFTFSNDCGNTETTSRTVSIINNIPPTLVCIKTNVALGPWNLDDDPEPDTEAACIYVDDLVVDTSTFHQCNTPFELSFSQDSIVKKMCFDCEDIGLNTVPIYAIDIYGNISSCIDTVDVQDNNDIDICLDVKTCVSEVVDTTLSLESGCIVFISGAEFDLNQINDECGELTITNDLTGTATLNGGLLQLGVNTITWTISVGPFSEDCEQTITVIDEIDPTIECGLDILALSSNFDGCEYVHSGSDLDPTFNDNCNIADVYHDYISAPSLNTLDGATFPIGETIVTWTVEDASGNSDQCTVTIVVEENEAPSLSCSSDASFNDTEDGSSLCNHTVTDTSLDPVVSDECSSDVTVSHDYGPAPSTSTLSGATFPIGTTTVTFTATDGFGNSTTCTVDITVVDNVDPEIACQNPQDFNESDDGNNDCIFVVPDDSLDPDVFDNCTSFTLEHNYADAPSSSSLEDAIFFIGSTEVIFTATDDAGNTAQCTVTVVVVDDVAPECTTQTDTSVNIGLSGIFIFTPSIITQPITDNCDSDLTYTFSPASVDCDDVGQTVVVTITATDDAGNSTDCPINVFVNEVADIECNPMDITVNLDEFGQVSIFADQVIDPGSSMCGTMPDVSIDPAMFDCEDIGVNAVTISISIGSDTMECIAMVTVLDEFVPSVICAPDVVFLDSSDGDFSCSHTVSDNSLDPIATTDNCDDFTITHDFGGTTDNTTLNGAVFTEEITTVLWTITDNGGTGQSNTCDIIITLIDDVDPTCVDQPIIPLIIGVSGEVTLDISMLPNPYTDNCAIASYAFTPPTLDCTDEGIVDVTVTVTDDSGNSSDCPVQFEVMVTDSISCSLNVDTVYLDMFGEVNLDAEVIVDIEGGICEGNAVPSLSSTSFLCNDINLSPVDITIFVNGDSCGVGSLMIADTIGPDVVCSPITVTCLDFENLYSNSLSLLLDGTEAVDSIWDNCPATLTTTTTVDSSGLNDCNYGMMTRTTISTDPLSGLSDTCVQVITIEGPADALTQEEIDGILPDTVLITECVIGDFMIDTITIADLDGLVDCGLFSISKEDVSISTGCPDTIVRTYTIDAICQDEIFESVQIVILNDEIAPVVEAIADTSMIIGLDCIASLDISALATASDDCTPTDMIGLTYSYDDVTADIGTIAEFEVGTYNVSVTAEDGCGNTDTTEFEVSVIDTIPIDVLCVKVIVFIDSITMTVDVPADLNVNVVGNCDNEAEIYVSYDSLDLSNTIMTFDCDDNETFIGVDIFVWQIVNGDTIPFDLVPSDTAVINVCKGEIEIQDPFNVCDPGIVEIIGEINTPTGDGIPDYSLTLNGSGLNPIFSNDEGEYAFPAMSTGGSYIISTYNNNDIMNGINTLDLILIQRHILGLSPFDSPYKYIAADVNNSEKITGADILELRKMVLGILTEFPNNMSWRTVDADFIFPDPTNPWMTQIPEVYKIPSLEQNMDVDFIGVKIGDVDGNVTVNLKPESSSSTRSNDAKVLMVENVENSNLIKVYADENLDVAGLQFTVDLSGMKIIDIVSDLFSPGQIGFNELVDGRFAISIAGSAPVAIGAEEVIFEIVTDCQTCDVSPMSFKLAKTRLDNEIYINESIETLPLALEIRGDHSEESLFVVYQNNPNPWTSFTKIDISLPRAENVDVKVYDVNGRLVSSSSQFMRAGLNTIEFDNVKIIGSGVYYYEISTSTRSERYKMIKLN